MFLLLVSVFLATLPGFGPRGEAVVSHPTNKRLRMEIQPTSNFGGHYFQTVGEEEAKNLNSHARKKRVKRSHPKTNQAQQTRIEDILTDQSLWGKDFPSVLVSLPAFTRAGEQQVAVFPDKILGRTKYTKRTAPPVARLARELKATSNRSPLSPKVRTLLSQGVISLTPQVLQLPDDKTFRLAAVGPSAEFLAPGLSIADVESRLGKEERVTTEVLDDGTERRPVILTLHHYAGGAIIFVESDVNPHIGSVDRVFLNAPQISTALF